MKNQKAFTLIELLVVVLIIGILSAIALPQYEKAVEKSKAAEAVTVLRAVSEAEEVYWLANGNFTDRFDLLDVDIAWTGREQSRTYNQSDVRSNADWSLEFYKDSDPTLAINVVRRSGPYKGAAFQVNLQHYQDYYHLQAPICREFHQTIKFPFQKQKGDYCEKIFHGTFLSGSAWSDNYTLP
ncbi:MAG: prepilin-type N-terminal cleavage/methylation domain-containing protein [Elusimicrobiaceae bacterium]|nr:prepilin-type N-terminal cleavage/methylation domain-containing protein [Elusimicrobiaceae bacterium]